ncbi:penicillin-binding protein 1B [Halioglobus japonicus]|uniref:Penicillin-binding protein 1B n=1 Tax=Halioglobus japonicus TaxID=930805 RepID=A0AAP8MBU0_9GAMM|nr:penicillin-binding protein 1B [Halioglobus japonicus]AQA17006.1 penicillin-binding protein 1B [Halioglobus japonicus]PLW84910.1 penicillin-binding protein 1B [Halioglobus japonicus]GHD18470.1 penicillin-binding protein 1B [Halioglobus japonicus]
MVKTRRLLFKLFLVALVVGVGFLIYLDARITSTFTDKMWELPAKVYARPLELYVGAELTPEDLAYELEVLGYRKVRHASGPGQVARNRNRFEVYTRGFDFPGESEPARRVTLDLGATRLQGITSSGAPVDLMRLDPVQIGGIYPSHGEDRLLIRLADVPDALWQALLAVEDQDFYEHWGFSVSGIARAALSNLRSGQVVAGGSTITQQLVKNYYLTPERTLVRKLTEVIMAVLLELHYEKDQILESYLNEVYLGQEGPRAIHGFSLAARHYFDTPLEQLGLHQQALLVGMIKGPSLYNPLRNPERAMKRRNVVLDVMAEQGVISDEHALVAKAMPLGLNNAPRIRNSFPAYLDLVRRQLRRDYREEDLTTLGLSIFTAFDPILQRKLESSTTSVLRAIDGKGSLQSASIVTRFDSGEVAALVGGRKVSYAGFNRVLDARRPAGSLLKPAVYLTALERPRDYSLATLLADEPISVPVRGSDDWQPRNFDRQAHGQVPLYMALAKSYNLATASLGLELGIENIADMLARLGVERPVPQVPALTLGAGEYSPMDMAAMYQTIASGGFRTPLRSIRDIVDARGEPLQRYDLQYEREVSLQAVYLLQYAMLEAMKKGTGRGAYRDLPANMLVAGKTGTTNDGRDSWFAGFSGDLLAVTWMGRDDNGETGLTGSSGALRIWSRFMAGASQRSLAYRMPEGVEVDWVDSSNGMITGEGCPNAVQMPFIEGSQPRAHTNCAPRTSRIKGWFQSIFDN